MKAATLMIYTAHRPRTTENLICAYRELIPEDKLFNEYFNTKTESKRCEVTVRGSALAQTGLNVLLPWLFLSF